MDHAFLNGQFRNEIGTGRANRLRNQGRIPGIIYGHSAISTPVEVDGKELNRFLRYYGESSLVGLDLGQGTKTVLIKEVQRDPVTHQVLHVDFQETRHDEKVKTVVPVVLIGRESIEKEGFILQHQLRELEIECLPHNIPRNLQVDVTSMDIGQAMTVGDVEMGEEISILNDIGEVIASLTQIRVSEDSEDIINEIQAQEDFDVESITEAAREYATATKHNKEEK